MIWNIDSSNELHGMFDDNLNKNKDDNIRKSEALNLDGRTYKQ